MRRTNRRLGRGFSQRPRRIAGVNGPQPFWLPKVVADLREAAADLLDPGLAKAAALGAFGGHGPLLRSLLAAADAYVSLMPGLLAQVEDSILDGANGEWRAVRLPRGAKASNAPYDYALLDGAAVPIRWLRMLPEQRADISALRWALQIATHLDRELHSQAARLESRIEEALLVRAGESEWAEQDAQALRRVAASVQRRVVALRQSEADIRRAAGRPISPSERPPSPYPQQAAWLRLKRLSRDLLNPELMLGPVLNQVLTDPIELADVPYLYQRWCGLQLLLAFERQGWSRRGDLVGPLLLGGRVELSRPNAADVVVWIEPRVSGATVGLTGWGVGPGKTELTPDFLITCGAAGWRDAFVLDATMSRSDEVLASKSKYLTHIVGLDTQFVAGVPVRRRPLRSWSVAPLDGTICRLSDAEGRTGGIPLHPGRLELGPLDAWVGDVSLHARRQEFGAPPATP